MGSSPCRLTIISRIKKAPRRTGAIFVRKRSVSNIQDLVNSIQKTIGDFTASERSRSFKLLKSKGLTTKDIAAEYGITRRRVEQILARGSL